MPQGKKAIHGAKMVVSLGHVWAWESDHEIYRGHWMSTKGNIVRIFPPRGMYLYWTVYVKGNPGREFHRLSGSHAEERAFVIAEAFTRQKR